MYKTIWAIKTENMKIELTYYHFGRNPQFPSSYMVEGQWYEIEMLWNLKLVHTFKIFYKCLTKALTIKGKQES